MANPQKENGHIEIANEIAEALMRVNLSAYESRVLWFLFRKTYGWGKKTDWITLSQFSQCIGLDRRLIHRAIKELSSKEMIVIERDDGVRLRYGFQKNYDKWNLSSKKMTVINIDDGLSSKEMIGLSSKEIHTKDNSTKDTLTKEMRIRFDLFWNAYPKKKSKGQAERTWMKLNPDEQLLARMCATIERAKKSEDWIKDRGKYVPYPATWLNAKGWEDEIDGVVLKTEPKKYERIPTQEEELAEFNRQWEKDHPAASVTT